jgi:hypothetical protein
MYGDLPPGNIDNYTFSQSGHDDTPIAGVMSDAMMLMKDQSRPKTTRRKVRRPTGELLFRSRSNFSLGGLMTNVL